MVGFCHGGNLPESHDENDDDNDDKDEKDCEGMFIKIMIMIMTKSHNGGNMSLIGEVGFCHRHIPTIDNHNDEVGFRGMVGKVGFMKV